MSAPPNSRGATITGKAQLVEYIAQGCKPDSAWRIGTEHEKFVFHLADHRPAGYDEPNGIRALILGMTRFGWEPVYEGDRPLALVKDLCSITLEPGGQFELSGAPLETIHDTCTEVHIHLEQVREVARELGLGMIGLGFEPKWRLEDMLEMFPNLAARADTAAGVMSGGEKQMLTICRTLMGDPELVMIDEPTEGLAPIIVQQVGDLIAEIARRGVAILLVEQKLSIAMRISHRVYVMGHGRIVFEGTPDELKANESVRKEWLEV